MPITLKQMLEVMQSGESFSCVVVSFDRRRKKGGRVLEYAEARLYDPREKQHATRGQTRREKLRAQLRSKRAPQHGKYFTRNIQLMVNGHPTGEIRKIHPPLVVRFNDQTVIG